MDQIEVLAIEDNFPDIETIRFMLSSSPGPAFAFSQARRLSEGIAAIERKQFDVVLLDLGLPDSQGIETAQRLRKQFPSMPIVVLTGTNDEALAIKTLQLDVQDYLIKGQIDATLLIRSIRYSIERKRAVEDLRQSEARFRRLSESGIIGVAFYELDGRITNANDKFLAMTGYNRLDLEQGRVRWDRLTPPEWMPRTHKAIDELQATGRISPYEKEYICKDGSKFWVLVGGSRLEGQQGSIAFVLDITEQKGTEARIKSAKALSDQLNNVNKLIHSTLDADTIMQNVIKEAGTVLGVHSAAIGTVVEDSLAIRYLHNIPAAFKDRCCSLKNVREVHYVCSAGDILTVNDISNDQRVNARFWKRFGISSLMLAPLIVRDEVIGIVLFANPAPFVFDDIHVDFANKLAASISLALDNARLFEEHKTREAEMRQIAHHDPLTGLPNRRLFIDIVNVEREQARRNRNKMGIFFLDLDRFKDVNDTYGHDVGDLLLKQATSQLRAHVRKSDTIARIGGDEFNIVLPGISRAEDTAEIAQNIIESFHRPFRIAGREMSITISIGISIFPDDGQDADMLLKRADAAMYHAKDAGRDNFLFYNPSMNASMVERVRFETMLGRSVAAGEILVYYQPLIDAATGKIVGAEGLARWQHPEKGILYPDDFIPSAEERELIHEMDVGVLRTVLAQLRSWLDAGLHLDSVSINLSAQGLHSPQLMETTATLLRETGVPPDSLSFEISEKTAMTDFDWTAARLRKLAAIGIHISIDHFGAGFYSLKHLERLPVDRLKIDRSMIRDVPRNPGYGIVVRSMTAMAHTLKMKVTAAGVETGDQRDFLKAAGCDEFQGYIFSKPLPAGEFTEMLRKKAA